MNNQKLMQLKLLLPYGVFIDVADVERMVLETAQGSFGLWPQRLDCVAALVPGILLYQCQARPEVYLAIDAGVLVKAGPQVSVSVRHAIAGDDLKQLRQTVAQDFIQQSSQQLQVHAVVQKMEMDFIRRLVAFRHDD
jgi:F-type H+-transporting ATPase subunit epsilon